MKNFIFFLPVLYISIVLSINCTAASERNASASSTLVFNGFGAPDAVAVGDFDGNGFDDVMWYESWQYKASFFMSDGIRFSASATFALNGFGPPDLVLIGDFDGNGKDDVMWYEEWQLKASFFMSDGTRFKRSSTLALTGFGLPDHVEAGDFDGNGSDDIMWYESWQSKATFFTTDNLYAMENMDNDQDSFTVNEGDCNDSNANIHPSATEICGDGIDQDCNGYDLPCASDNLTLADLAGTYNLKAFTVNYDSGITLTQYNFDSFSGTMRISANGDMSQTITIADVTESQYGSIISVGNDTMTLYSSGCTADIGIDFSGNILTTTFYSGTCGAQYSEIEVWEKEISINKEVETSSPGAMLIDQETTPSFTGGVIGNIAPLNFF